MRLERVSYSFSLLFNFLLKDQYFSELIINFVQFIAFESFQISICRLSYLESVFNEVSSVNKDLHSKLSYMESRLNEALSENKDLRRELELSKSKEVRKPFHHNSRRFEKKGISKRFFSDTRDESYSAEGVCDRTLSGEFLQYCILLLNCYFSWP